MACICMGATASSRADGAAEHIHQRAGHQRQRPRLHRHGSQLKMCLRVYYMHGSQLMMAAICQCYWTFNGAKHELRACSDGIT